MSTELMLADSALSINSMMQQRALVVQAMKDVMTEGQHYGLIPGCGSMPSLLQPGAQTLAFMFRLRPEYTVEYIDLPQRHREVRVLCKLVHGPSGMEAGQGVGLCSSMESKYRFRNEAKKMVPLNEPVPGVYWNLKRKRDNATDSAEREQRTADLEKWIGVIFPDRDASTIGAKKTADGYTFVEYHGGDGKTENPAIDDVFNTILKIAKKRAFVDSIITATASSDLFTQDLEDIRDNLETVEPTPEPPKTATTEPAKGTGTAKAAKTPAKAVKKPTQGSAGTTTPTAGGGVKTWKDTVVHIGDKKGSIFGKRLGDLPELSITNLRKKVGQIPEDKRTKEDNLLIAAIAAHDGEKEGGKSEGETKPELPPGVVLLRDKCEALKLDMTHVLKVLQKQGSKATTLEEIPQEEAQYLLKDWDRTLQAIKDEGDNLP